MKKRVVLFGRYRKEYKRKVLTFRGCQRSHSTGFCSTACQLAKDKLCDAEVELSGQFALLDPAPQFLGILGHRIAEELKERAVSCREGAQAARKETPQFGEEHAQLTVTNMWMPGKKKNTTFTTSTCFPGTKRYISRSSFWQVLANVHNLTSRVFGEFGRATFRVSPSNPSTKKGANSGLRVMT